MVTFLLTKSKQANSPSDFLFEVSDLLKSDSFFRSILKFLFKTAVKSCCTKLVDFPKFCSQNFLEIDVSVLGMQTRTKVYEMFSLMETPDLYDLWSL